MIFKKPLFWDISKPNLFAYLLLPLTIPIRVNNLLLKYKKKINSKKTFTICIGNIYVGGTGKTPMSIKLFKILKKNKLKVFIGKKNYSNQKDEKEILKKNSNLITASSREKILEKIKNKSDVLIFDDGLQDKKITYDLKFVCFDTYTWIGNGFLIPAGPLRENLNSLKKYDGVFVKNSTNLKNSTVKILKKINKKIKIFFTEYKIVNKKNFDLDDNYLIFSGIGNPIDFKNILLKNQFNIVHEIIFPDHFDYKTNDIDEIKKIAKKLNLKIITTEKDFVKLSKKNKKQIKFIKIDINIKNEKNLINFIKKKYNEKT